MDLGWLMVLIGGGTLFFLLLFGLFDNSGLSQQALQNAKVSYKKGKNAEKMGDYKIAMGHYREADKLQKWSAELLTEKGKQANKYEDDFKRANDKLIKQNSVRVNQKIVQGDQITKTEIKDSVLNRSNVGGGSSKAEELREAKALLDEGLINEEDYEKMKKEILGK